MTERPCKHEMTLAKLWEYGQEAIRRAESIKNDKAQSNIARDRAQAQADSWRAMMVLIREDGHEFEDTGKVMGGANTAPGAAPRLLCPIHRTTMTQTSQNAEARRYECPSGCKWEQDWRHIWPDDVRRTGLTPWTATENVEPEARNISIGDEPWPDD